MEKQVDLNLTKLITTMCNAIVSNNFEASKLYSSLKIRVPDERQRLNAVIKVIEEEFYSHYLFILSKLSSFDGSHS